MKRPPIFQFLVILGILAVAAYLRVYNIAIFPGWNNDEGTVINIAQNLAKGRTEYLGVQDSILFAARQPLFVWILSLIFRAFGDGITVLRLFTGVLGVLNTLIIFFIFKKKSLILAAISAFIYAILPDAVITSRIGFSYNLTSFLGILGFLFASIYYESGVRGYGIASGFILGLGLSSDLAAIIFLPALLIVVFMKRWQDLFSIILIFFLPSLIYVLVMIFVAPNAFIFDLQFIIFRVNKLPLPGKLIIYLMNIITLSQRVFFILGLLGILLSRDHSIKRILSVFTLVPFFIVGCIDNLENYGIYKLVPMYPIFALGIGLLIYEVIHKIHKTSIKLIARINNTFSKTKINIRSYFVAATDLVLIFPFLIAPLIGMLINFQLQFTPQKMPDSLVDSLSTVVPLTQILTNPFVPVALNGDEAKAVVDYVNGHVAENDMILASPAIAWAIKGNVTDYVLSLAYNGQENMFFPTNIPKSRFRFGADYKEARYIVVDNIWRNFFEINMPASVKINEEIEEMNIVFQTKTISVYQRPD